MTAEPLVSIGALNYNNGKYVIETLESIKNQSYSNTELIIVDDCSTDDSVELIKGWLKNYTKPYKFIIHETNKGVCATVNDTLRNASGKYFSYIATDDVMMPDKLKVQVELLENTSEDVGAVYSDAYMIKDDGTPSYGWYIQWYRNDFEDVPNGDLFGVQMDGGFLPAMSVLTKMDCLKRVGYFDENLPYEDYDMWLRIAKSYKILFSDYVSVKYRRRNGSLRTTIKNWRWSYITIYLKHINDHPKALRNIRDNAKHTYLSNDEQAYKVLAQSVAKDDPFVKRVLQLMKLNIPKKIGSRIIRLLEKRLISA